MGTGQIETGEVGTGRVINMSSWDWSIPEGLGLARTDNVRAGQAWSDEFGSGQARKFI